MPSIEYCADAETTSNVKTATTTAAAATTLPSILTFSLLLPVAVCVFSALPAQAAGVGRGG